jgi:hypothetical protein
VPLVPLHPVDLVRLPRIRLISQDWVTSSLFPLIKIKLKYLANFPVRSFAFVNLRKVRIAPLKSEAHLCFSSKNSFKVKIIFLVNSVSTQSKISFEPCSCSEVRPSSVRSANLNTFKLLLKIDYFRYNVILRKSLYDNDF